VADGGCSSYAVNDGKNPVITAERMESRLLAMGEFDSLLQAPSPAVLTTYRKDGTAAVSPVWFRFQDNTFEIVIAQDHVKLRHLAARPECELVVFEAVPPFRGVRVRSRQPMLDPAGALQARAEIATRYLGEERGSRFAAERASPGICCAFHGMAPRRGTLHQSCRADRLAGTPSAAAGPSGSAAPARFKPLRQ
jgi:hypothetical protein